MTAVEPVAAESTTAGAAPARRRPAWSRRRPGGGAEIPAAPARAARVTVDLLPPEVRASRRAHRVRRVVLAALVVLVLALAGWSVAARAGVGLARDELAAADAVSAGLRSQQVRYADVARAQDALVAADRTTATLGGRDVAWTPLWRAIDAAAPAGVVVTSLQATGPAGDDAATSAAGGLTLAGISPDEARVAAFVDALTGVDGLDRAAVTGLEALPAGGFSFAIAAGVTDAAVLRTTAAPTAGGR